MMQYKYLKLLALCAAMLLLHSAATLSTADLQAKFDQRIARAKLKRTSVAVVVMDLQSDRIIARQGADLPMIPASNMKLFTTAAALEQLGPDFAFTTRLRLVNTKDTATLVVQGDGDPAFGDPKILDLTPRSALVGTPYEGKVLDVELLLTIWADQVRKAGVRRISRLIIDDRVFDQKRVHSTWPKDQLNKWYCAEVSGLNFHTNCIEIFAAPTAPGAAPRVWFSPAAPFLRVTNNAKTGPKNGFWAARNPGTNQLLMAGQVKHRLIEPVDLTLTDPALFFGKVFSQRLGKVGVAVDGITRPINGQRLSAGKSLHVVRTPLPVILRRCNKDSQNLYAESLIKRIGHQFSGQPGSWSNGAAAMERFLYQKIGAKYAEQVRLADGSGMSRQNRITAGATVQLLRAMYRDRKLGRIYRKSLSVGGVDGTLSKRLKTGLTGTVHAKTGYINQVRTLSGYVVSRGRLADKTPTNVNTTPRVFAFSMLFNNIRHPVSGYQVKQLQDDLVRLIDAYAR